MAQQIISNFGNTVKTNQREKYLASGLIFLTINSTIEE